MILVGGATKKFNINKIVGSVPEGHEFGNSQIGQHFADQVVNQLFLILARQGRNHIDTKVHVQPEPTSLSESVECSLDLLTSMFHLYENSSS